MSFSHWDQYLKASDFDRPYILAFPEGHPRDGSALTLTVNAHCPISLGQWDPQAFAQALHRIQGHGTSTSTPSTTAAATQSAGGGPRTDGGSWALHFDAHKPQRGAARQTNSEGPRHPVIFVDKPEFILTPIGVTN